MAETDQAYIDRLEWALAYVLSGKTQDDLRSMTGFDDKARARINEIWQKAQRNNWARVDDMHKGAKRARDRD